MRKSTIAIVVEMAIVTQRFDAQAIPFADGFLTFPPPGSAVSWARKPGKTTAWQRFMQRRGKG